LANVRDEQRIDRVVFLGEILSGGAVERKQSESRSKRIYSDVDSSACGPYHAVDALRIARSTMSQHSRQDAPSVTTDLIFQTDAYCSSFQAQVVAADEAERAVALERTAFYAGGGGQPPDTGTLRLSSNGEIWPVTGVSTRDGLAWHVIGESAPLPQVGANVTGEIDWDRRYRLMRTHTALHVLCGVVYRDFGALVTGGNMSPEKARMDFELDDLSPDRVAAIERAANDEIVKGREVRVRILPREEAFRIPDLIRTKLNLLPDGITEVRTVEIVGLDLQADGGTHVANTREVGGLRVIGTRSKGRINKRLEIELVHREGPIDAPEGSTV
jgi:misacylated tRNA(Ala) deacylase